MLTWRWLAELRLGQGRLEDAEQLLAEALRQTGGGPPPSSTGTANALARYAEVARRRGDLEAARSRLAESAAAFGYAEAMEDPRSESMPSTVWRCAAARIRRDGGDLDGARDIARSGWQRLTGETALSARVDALVCWVELSQPKGPHDLGPEIDSLIAEVQAVAGASDPWVRELRSLTRSSP